MTRRVFIVGAARSGTKVFRDTLAAATDVGAVPYDINFVWRYGNETEVDDVLDPSTVNPRIRRFIMRYVDKYARDGIVLEKTVGNTLRTPFVRSVFADAVFVHLIRDGVDSVVSTRSQWVAPADRSYLLRKARHFPLRLVPGYGRKYVASLVSRKIGNGGRIGSWGVRYPGIDRDLIELDLLTVCARQWRESVERATRDLAGLDAPAITVKYEDFVNRPAETLAAVAEWLELAGDSARIDRAVELVTEANVGKGVRRLSDTELALVAKEIDGTLEMHGYPPTLKRKNEHGI